MSPAAVAVAPAAVANRSDVRLMSSFSLFLRAHKLDLSALFCTEPILSADTRVVCELQTEHHGELLGEYLTSGNLRVGEELPHWFVNGNLRGAIKCWMATRPAAAALTDGLAAGTTGEAAVAAMAASVVAQGSLGASAARLVDPLLAAMPVWKPGQAVEMSGWEAAGSATEEDVSLLHCFGSLVYASRLDMTEFLQQLCGADPFSWAMVQVAQGVISEPEPWLLERYFMSRHVVSEPLPLWFATWGVRDEVRQWLQGPKAAALVDRLFDARGSAAAARDGSQAAPAAAAASSGADALQPPSQVPTNVSAALDLLEVKAAKLLGSLVPCSSSSSSSTAAAPVLCQRGALLSYAADPVPVPSAADIVARRDGDGAALVAAAVQLPADQATAEATATAVRQAKERLDWLSFLVQEEATGTAAAAVARVLVLVGAGDATSAGEQQLLAPSVALYLGRSGVRCVSAAELVRL